MRGFIPGGINPDLVSLTGGIVVWWGMIESVLANDIIQMSAFKAVNADKECWPIQIATKRLIAQWARARRLVHGLWTDPHFDSDAAAERLRYCADIRHRLVHSFWGYGSTTPRDDFILSSLKPSRTNRDAVDTERYLIDVPSLDDFNDSLRRLYHDLMAANLRLHLEQNRGRPPAAPTNDERAPLDARLHPPKPILAR